MCECVQGSNLRFQKHKLKLKTMYLHHEKDELERSSTTWRLEIRFF